MIDAVKSKEEHEQVWWARWRDEDYSWDGLAEKPWLGWVVVLATNEILEATDLSPGVEARWATLQDYWRDEEAHLIDGDRKRWTRAHCPLEWINTIPTPKTEWSEAEHEGFSALLLRKFAQGDDTTFSGSSFLRLPIGADRRAQFQGCVFLEAPSHPAGAKLSARFEQSFFAKRANFSGANFSGDTTFFRARFAAEADFMDATFVGVATFKSALFSGHANFGAAVFSDGARFDIASFYGGANFAAGTFSSYANFDKAALFGYAILR